MRTIIFQTFLILTVLSQAMSVTGQQWPSPALQQFTASYCIDCHGEKNIEGNFSISTLDTNIRDGDHYEQWRLVLEQLQFGDMPPDGARQPAIAERKIVVEQLRHAPLCDKTN